MELINTLFIFIIGTCVGSFLNVLIERTNREESIKGRSYCESCKKKLLPKDLIPLFSYLFSKGKCKYCGTQLSIQYLLMEIVTGILFALVYILISNNLFMQNDYFFNTYHLPFFNNILPLIYYLIICSALLALFVSDIKYGYLFDKITIPTILFVFCYKVFSVGSLLASKYLDLNESQFGQLLIKAGFIGDRIEDSLTPLIYTIGGSLLIAMFFLLLIVATKGRAMGGGDVKLGFLIGLITGWPHMLMAIMIGFLTGSITSIILILIRKRTAKQTIPFGPFLIFGCFLMMFFGNQLFDWYLFYILGLEPLTK